MTETETIITRSVPFALTDAEVALKAKLYADGSAECEMDLLRIKARAKRDTEEVAKKQAELLDLRSQCSSRKEHRVVDCFRDPDLGARVWRIRRCDNGDVVDTQKMTAEEVADMRQLDLIDELASKAAALEAVPPAPPSPSPTPAQNDDVGDANKAAE